MDDIVQDALDNQEEEQRNNKVGDLEELEELSDPRIVIVGCGGAGNNTVNRLYNIGVKGADTVAVNTDKQHLLETEADTTILIGKDYTNGLGAGGDPSQGRTAAQRCKGTLKEVLEGADLVFVTAGMGGGTGTGATPVIAEIAKECGAIVVGMVSTPFEVERARMDNAREGLNRLNESADSIIVLDNERLLDYVPNLPIGKAFSVMDQIIAETVKGISETITQPSLINLDYADIKSVMSQGGVAVMLVGETSEKNNKIDDVIDDAMSHPLLDVDYSGSDGGLVHITGGENISLKEATDISKGITARLNRDAKVIWGARIEEDYKDKVRVMAIMTGVESSQILGNNSSFQHTTEQAQDSSNDLEQEARDMSSTIDTIR